MYYFLKILYSYYFFLLFIILGTVNYNYVLFSQKKSCAVQSKRQLRDHCFTMLNFGLNFISIDFENKCKEVLQFYNKKAWINPVT